MGQAEAVAAYRAHMRKLRGERKPFKNDLETYWDSLDTDPEYQAAMAMVVKAGDYGMPLNFREVMAWDRRGDLLLFDKPYHPDRPRKVVRRYPSALRGTVVPSTGEAEGQ